ncbi:MAG: inner membrane protein [Saprospiraceae bacterium]|jgi:inner membrane protein|tara:strand:- start:1099 stop:1629 length:531 start_codon:yes stop_codon:yes gene_type:complete
MASVFGHAALAGAIGVALPKVLRRKGVILLGVLCSILPDLDVLSFNLGIPYHGFWGHRGMTHSIVFGAGFGLLVMILFHFRAELKDKLILAFYYMFCTISHGVLDGMTTGGMGIAYFSPFDDGRYFLPFRMIKVSPIGISRFFNEWGLAVLKSEFIWIGTPCLIFVLMVFIVRKLK